MYHMLQAIFDSLSRYYDIWATPQAVGWQNSKSSSSATAPLLTSPCHNLNPLYHPRERRRPHNASVPSIWAIASGDFTSEYETLGIAAWIQAPVEYAQLATCPELQGSRLTRQPRALCDD